MEKSEYPLRWQGILFFLILLCDSKTYVGHDTCSQEGFYFCDKSLSDKTLVAFLGWKKWSISCNLFFYLHMAN